MFFSVYKMWNLCTPNQLLLMYFPNKLNNVSIIINNVIMFCFVFFLHLKISFKIQVSIMSLIPSETNLSKYSDKTNAELFFFFPSGPQN